MKKLIAFMLISLSSFALVQNHGSIIVNKKTGSALYMECAMMQMGSDQCDMYKAVIVTDDKIEQVNPSLYKAILNSGSDYYINGKSINYNEYGNTYRNVAKNFDKIENKQKKPIYKTLISIPLTIAEIAVLIGETAVDGSINGYKKSKDLVLDAKYKGILTKLFDGKKEELHKVSNKRFKNIIKFISDI